MLKLKYILYIFIIIWKMNMYNYFMENKQKQNDLTTLKKSFEQPIDVQGITNEKNSTNFDCQVIYNYTTAK